MEGMETSIFWYLLGHGWGCIVWQTASCHWKQLVSCLGSRANSRIVSKGSLFDRVGGGVDFGGEKDYHDDSCGMEWNGGRK